MLRIKIMCSSISSSRRRPTTLMTPEWNSLSHACAWMLSNQTLGSGRNRQVGRPQIRRTG